MKTNEEFWKPIPDQIIEWRDKLLSTEFWTKLGLPDYSMQHRDLTRNKLLLVSYVYQVAYSYNSKSRAYTKNILGDTGMCVYSELKEEGKVISPGCAIGQFFSEEHQELLDSIGGDIIDVISNDEIGKYGGKIIPSWMKKINPDTLCNIQRLHDVASNWNEKGLTEDGKKSFRRLLGTISPNLIHVYSAELVA